MGTAQQVGSYRHIAPTIEILDCTLRDGEQTSGVSFMPHEKLMIARILLQDIMEDSHPQLPKSIEYHPDYILRVLVYVDKVGFQANIYL